MIVNIKSWHYRRCYSALRLFHVFSQAPIYVSQAPKKRYQYWLWVLVGLLIEPVLMAWGVAFVSLAFFLGWRLERDGCSWKLAPFILLHIKGKCVRPRHLTAVPLAIGIVLALLAYPIPTVLSFVALFWPVVIGFFTAFLPDLLYSTYREAKGLWCTLNETFRVKDFMFWIENRIETIRWTIDDAKDYFSDAVEYEQLNGGAG